MITEKNELEKKIELYVSFIEDKKIGPSSIPSYLKYIDETERILQLLREDKMTSEEFDKLSSRDKWDVAKLLINVNWCCKNCGLSQGSKKPESTWGEVYCSNCDSLLTERTGGGQNDPFNYSFTKIAGLSGVKIYKDYAKKYTLTESEKKNLRKMLAELKQRASEPDPGPFRGRSRPSNEEFEQIIGHIHALKNFIVRGQAYELAAKIRDFEKEIISIRDSHPEQFKNEVFIMNIKKSEVDKILISKHIDVQSSRVGIKAYKENSTDVLKGYVPVFVVMKPVNKGKSKWPFPKKD